MKCPRCNEELITHSNYHEVKWLNKNDTVAEVLCYAHCWYCNGEFKFKKIYVKAEEIELQEME